VRRTDARTVSIRPYRGDQRKGVALDDFVAEVTREIADRVTPDRDA
jgi:hypothetical protein